MIRTQSIPTVYEGIRFRSRLEATWACFFDNIGWSWEYEPFDLNGYIPDFILTLHENILVEVKPEINSTDNLRQYIEKPLFSGWENEILIVGGKIFESYGRLSLGLLGGNDIHWCEGCTEFEDAILFQCFICDNYSFFHNIESYRCRVKGCGDGDHHILWEPSINAEILEFWKMAKNSVQWKAP